MGHRPLSQSSARNRRTKFGSVSVKPRPNHGGPWFWSPDSPPSVFVSQCVEMTPVPPAYYAHSTWSRTEEQRNIEACGNVVFDGFWAIPSISPVFLWNVSSVIVIVISTHNCTSVSLSGIGYVMCKVIYRFHGLPIDNPIGQVFDSPFGNNSVMEGDYGMTT